MGALIVCLVAVLVALLLVILGRLPRMTTGWIVGFCAVVMLVWFLRTLAQARATFER